MWIESPPIRMMLSRNVGSLSTRGRSIPTRSGTLRGTESRPAAVASESARRCQRRAAGRRRWAGPPVYDDRTGPPPAYASAVRPPARASRSAHPLGLGAERVAAGDLDLPGDRHAALQVPARLPHDRARCRRAGARLGRAARRRGEAGRPGVRVTGAPAEEVGRIERHPHGRRPARRRVGPRASRAISAS